VAALDLSGCGIHGELGDVLSISTLVNVSVANNVLTGTIPKDFAASMRFFTAYGNQFSGTLDNLAIAKSLETADMHYNSFSSTPAASIGSMESLAYISVANNKLTGTIPAEWGKLKKLQTIGLAYNELTGSLAPLGQMPFLSVIFVRNNSFSGPVPGLPKAVSAFYVDGNAGLDSVDIDAICDSAPPGGFNQGGCNVDWPDARAINSCCMKGDKWSASILQLDCLKPCFDNGPTAPTPAPPAPSDTYTCLVPEFQCKAVAGSSGQFPTNASCQAECHAPESYNCLVPQFQCAPANSTIAGSTRH
jgi:hypothetical protein